MQTLKPKQITTVAVLCLIDGVLNIAYGLISFITVFFANFLGLFIGTYLLVLGILEIRYAISLFSDPIKVTKPAQYIPIMQIVSILTMNLFTLFLGSPIIGVVILILHNANEVKTYFQARQSLSLDPQNVNESTTVSGNITNSAIPSMPSTNVSILGVISLITGILAWIPIPFVNVILDIIAIVTGRSAIHEVQNSNGVIKGKILGQLGVALGAVNIGLFGCLVFGTILTGLFSGGSLTLAIIELIKTVLDTINNFVPRFLPPIQTPTPTPTSWLIWLLV